MTKNVWLGLVLTTVLGSLWTDSLCAQESHHPQISIVHRGVGTLKSDLKALIDLTTETEQEQWVNLQDYLDLLAIGVDEERPIRVDILTGIQPTPYLIWIPYSGDDGLLELRDNLEAFGFETRRDPQDANLYRIQPPDQGWFRVMPDIEYVVLVFTTESDDVLLKQIVMKAGDPIPAVKSLLDTGASVGAQLTNSATSADDQKKRRDSFAELRSVSMDAVQKRPDESETEFELRRGALSNQLDELERLMVEAAELKAWITVDQKDSIAQLHFSCSAIAETSLATTIGEFNQQPDAFAAIKPLAESVFSGRLNHPIDAMRQANILSFLELLGNDIDARVAESEKLSDSEREATKKLFHGVSGLIAVGAKTGNVNAFTESKPDGKGDFVTIGAISSPEAAKLIEILPHLADAREGNKVELNIEEVDGVAIHKIRLAKGFVDLIDTFFGEERDLYIGTAESHVWLASGEGAPALDERYDWTNAGP